MNLHHELLTEEFYKMGGPKLSVPSTMFMAKISELLPVQKKISILEATLLTGYDEEGDESLFIPLCERLLAMGFLRAYTELTHDEFQEDVIDRSLRPGILMPEDYSEESRVKLGLKPGEGKYAIRTIYASPDLHKMWKALTEDRAKT